MKKKIIYSVIILMSALFFAPKEVEAQNADSVAVVENISIKSTGNKDEFSVAVAGFDLRLGAARVATPKCPTTTLSVCDNIEFGISPLVNTDYSDYNAAQDGFMNQRVIRSFHFGGTIVRVKVRLCQWANFNMGVNMLVDNYVFDDHITLESIGGKVEPVPIADSYKKSKLATCYFGVPAGFSFKLAPGFRWNVAGDAEVLASSVVKYKNPKEKSKNLSGLNQFQFGGYTSFTYRHFGVFGRYVFSPLFADGNGPEAHTFSVGICFDL